MNRKKGVVGFFVNQNRVLLFLIKYSENDFKWNGIGGFIDENETPQDALVREIKEEIGVNLALSEIEEVKEVEEKDLSLTTFLIHKPDLDFKIVDKTLIEFKWFDFEDIPYEKMWEGNKKWLPEVLGA